MQILRKGNINKRPKELVFVCKKCGCVFEDEKEECTAMFGSIKFPDIMTTNYFKKCPECYTECKTSEEVSTINCFSNGGM